jgi:hypothetical protein
MMKHTEEVDVCFSVTLLDGLVLAKSAFHHSANYRSAMIFGRASLVTDESNRVEQLRVLVDSFFPGRWEKLRPVSDAEMIATSILSIRIEEFSVKIRTGGPVDDEGDFEWPVWSGVVPINATVGDLVPFDSNPELVTSKPDIEQMRHKFEGAQ